MKKKQMVALAALVLFSCKKQSADLINSVPNLPTVKNMTSRYSTGPFFNWETQTQITLGNGQLVTLPWYNGAATNIPDYILTDYTSADGWEMLYNAATDNANPGQYYLIFYNKLRGVLRTYYYQTNNVTSTSDGIWRLSLTTTNSALNSQGYFTLPIDQPRSLPDAISTNVSVNTATKSITLGWNCFDTEITYDPAIPTLAAKMRVGSFDQNYQAITLAGQISTVSSGTIVTSSNSNPAYDYSSKAAKAAGSGASEYVKKNTGTSSSNSLIKAASNLLVDITSGVVSSMVSGGINLIFGSFFGKFSTTSSSSQNIDFKTNGTVNFTGSLTGSSGNNVIPYANIYFPAALITNDTDFPFYTSQLGLWNIDHNPVVQEGDKVFLDGQINGIYHYYRNVYLDNTSFNVVVNPQVSAYIDHYEVESELIYYFKFLGGTNWAPGATSVSSTVTGDVIYDDGDNLFFRHPQESFNTRQEPLSTPEGDVVTFRNYNNVVTKNYVVKVTLKLFPKAPYNTNPLVFTRSYLPDYHIFAEQ